MRPWQAIMSENEREIAAKAGFGRRQEFGKRPALIVIDVTETFTGSAPRPTLEAIEEYRLSCGNSAWSAMESIKQLLDTARECHIPVVHTKGDPVFKAACGDSVKGTSLADIQRLYTTGIHPMVAPREDEFVLQKTKASAFFATPLSVFLTRQGIDCLVVCGTTTSGCVRATVVDGWSHGYPIFLVEQGCFDRLETSHLVNLFDMNAKYADVIQLDEAVTLMRGVSAGQPVATPAL